MSERPPSRSELRSMAALKEQLAEFKEEPPRPVLHYSHAVDASEKLKTYVRIRTDEAERKYRL